MDTLSRLEALELAAKAWLLVEKDRLENGEMYPFMALYQDAMEKTKKALAIPTFSSQDTRELPKI